MTSPAAFKQADLERALRAARATGMKVAAMRIAPGTGEIELEFAEGAIATRKNPLDRLYAA